MATWLVFFPAQTTENQYFPDDLCHVRWYSIDPIKLLNPAIWIAQVRTRASRPMIRAWPGTQPSFGDTI